MSDPDAWAKCPMLVPDSPAKLAIAATAASPVQKKEQLIRSVPSSPQKQVPALAAEVSVGSLASPEFSPVPSPPLGRASKRAAQLRAKTVAEKQRPGVGKAQKAKNRKGDIEAKEKLEKGRNLGRSNKVGMVRGGVGSPCSGLEGGSPSGGGTAAGHRSPSLVRPARSAPVVPSSPSSPVICANPFGCLADIGSAFRTADLEAGLGVSRGSSSAGRSLAGEMDAVVEPARRGFFGRICSAVKKAVGGMVSAVKSALGGLFRRGP